MLRLQRVATVATVLLVAGVLLVAATTLLALVRQPASATGGSDPRPAARGAAGSAAPPARPRLPALTARQPRAAYRPPRPTAVGLGDSITAYAGSWLWRLAADRRSPVRVIRNAGVPGDETAGMLARLDRDVLRLRPQVVFVMGGTNDMHRGRPVAATDANLTAIVDRLQARGVRVVLFTLPPSNRTPGRVAAENAGIRRVAAEQRVRLVDVYARLGRSDGRWQPGLSYDGVHPSPAGQHVMAEQTLRTLRRWRW